MHQQQPFYNKSIPLAILNSHAFYWPQIISRCIRETTGTGTLSPSRHRLRLSSSEFEIIGECKQLVQSREWTLESRAPIRHAQGARVLSCNAQLAARPLALKPHSGQELPNSRDSSSPVCAKESLEERQKEGGEKILRAKCRESLAIKNLDQFLFVCSSNFLTALSRPLPSS